MSGGTSEHAESRTSRPSERWREQVLVPRMTAGRALAAQMNQAFLERQQAAVERRRQARAVEAEHEKAHRKWRGEPIVPKPGRGDGLKRPAPIPKPSKVRLRNGGAPFAWLRRSAGVGTVRGREPNPMRGLIMYHYQLRLEKWERRRRNKAGAQMRARQRRMGG